MNEQITLTIFSYLSLLIKIAGFIACIRFLRIKKIRPMIIINIVLFGALIGLWGYETFTGGIPSLIVLRPVNIVSLSVLFGNLLVMGARYEPISHK